MHPRAADKASSTKAMVKLANPAPPKAAGVVNCQDSIRYDRHIRRWLCRCLGESKDKVDDDDNDDDVETKKRIDENHP